MKGLRTSRACHKDQIRFGRATRIRSDMDVSQGSNHSGCITALDQTWTCHKDQIRFGRVTRIRSYLDVSRGSDLTCHNDQIILNVSQGSDRIRTCHKDQIILGRITRIRLMHGHVAQLNTHTSITSHTQAHKHTHTYTHKHTNNTTDTHTRTCR
jgi:hypothetical protein